MLRYLYAKGFRFELVNSPAMLDMIYRLRYDIYARELKLIDKKKYPQERETDRFDRHSIHIAAFDFNHCLAGAVRIVFHSPLGFPTQEHCHYPLFKAKGMPRCDNIAEVSRLVIAKKYRKWQWKKSLKKFLLEYPFSLLGNFSLRINPLILGLYIIGYQVSKDRKVTHWLATMERPLFKILKKHGFYFSPLGECVNYYGKVTPYLGDIEVMEKAVYQANPGLRSIAEAIFPPTGQPSTT